MALECTDLPQHGTAVSAESSDTTTLVKDGTLASFMDDVIVGSQTRLVLVEFWAPWCGPCRQLMPVLEALVHESRGAMALVKINVDTQQPLAMQMGVQSVPMVYLFKDGKPVDGFNGALPVSQIKAICAPWLGAVVSPLDQMIDDARAASSAGDWSTAQALYNDAHTHAPDDPRVQLGRVLSYLKCGDHAQARILWNAVSQLDRESAEGRAVHAALHVADLAAAHQHDDAMALEHQVARDPANLDTRFDLAMAYLAQGDHYAAVDTLLAIMAADRTWADRKAQHQLVTVFESLGFDNPVSVKGRKAMAKLLFA